MIDDKKSRISSWLFLLSAAGLSFIVFGLANGASVDNLRLFHFGTAIWRERMHLSDAVCRHNPSFFSFVRPTAVNHLPAILVIY
jgi:hypothetical protein